MPLPNPYNHILDMYVFNQQYGIDGEARTAMHALLAYAGLDDVSTVFDTPASDLSVVKLRSLFTTVSGQALLAAVEANDGQLNRISAFLRKVQSGTCARFIVDHNPSNDNHLKLLTGGSADVHAYSDEWTSYVFNAALADKLKLSNTASFRNAVTYIRQNLPDIAYLLNPLPQDNFTTIGKKKDDNLRQFWTLLITSSNLENTFSLGLVNRTGLALSIQARNYFLSESDTLIEIQTLNARFANLKMTKGVKHLNEELKKITDELKELGKITTNIEFYTKLLTLLSDNRGHLQTMCVAFKVANLVPTDETLNKFLTFITNDHHAMAIGVNDKNDGAAKVDANSLHNEDKKKLKKKEKRAINQKGYEAAMNSLKTSATDQDVPRSCINIVERVRIKWNDENIGMHSDLNKVWNANTSRDGKIDYDGFIAQIQREHAQGKTSLPPPSPSPSHPTRRNPNVAQANALEADAYAVDIFRDKDFEIEKSL